MKFKTNKDVRIVYMGTPEISAKVLERVLQEGFSVVGVISNEDKEVGRKRIKEPTPVKKVALEHGVPVYQPHRIRLEHDFLKKIDFDVLLTMAYGQIVPEEVLQAPCVGAVNLHGSLLPEYRGAAPIQRAIMDGKSKTGVTLMEMVKEMDAGRMYDKLEVDIAPKDNYSSLQEKISFAAGELAARDLLKYANGELPGVEQNPSDVTFATKILPENEHIPLDLPISSLLCYIRGLSLTPGGYFLIDGKKLKVFEASLFSKETRAPLGQILPNRKKLLVQASGGILSLDLIQLEGKKVMDACSFLNGAKGLEGKRLE